MKSGGGKILPRRSRYALFCGLVAIWTCPVVLCAVPTTTPVAEIDWFADAMAEVEGLMRQLRQMRIRGDVKAEAVAKVLQRGVTLLDQTDQRLSKELDLLRQKTYPSRTHGTVTGRPVDSQRRQLKARRCQVGLFRGEIHYAAAIALPSGEKARREYLDFAMAVFRAIPVLYLDVPLGWMGYLGQAKVHRAAGAVELAHKVLDRIIEVRIAPGDNVLLQVRRAARLDKLETYLLTEPGKAIAEGQVWRNSRTLRGEPVWGGRIDWVLGRAWAAEAARLKKTSGTADAARNALARAADLLRREAVIEVAPVYERLAVLERLDALGGGKLMTRSELLQLADILGGLGKIDALRFYRRALSIPGAPLSVDRQYARIALLGKEGNLSETADACDALVKHAPGDHPHRLEAIKLRGAALLELYRKTGEDKAPAKLVNRLRSALRSVVDSKLPRKVRQDALIQWVGVETRRVGPRACVGILGRHGELVGEVPYLLYVRAAGKWEALRGRISDEPIARTPEQVRQILRECESAQRVAVRAVAKDIAACCALLRAQILHAAPLRDLQGALKILREESVLIAGDRRTADMAASLKVKVLLDLGLTDAALRAYTGLSGSLSGAPVRLPLRLAEDLAARYIGPDPSGRRRVVELCNRAMGEAAGDERLFAAAGRRSARAMLKVGASADARKILGELLRSEVIRKDPKATLDCSLMLVEALRQGGQWNDAKVRSMTLVERFPDVPEVHLVRGRLEMQVKQPGKAVEAFRRARKLCAPGSPEWCQATLGLAEGLHASGRSSAAADILRASGALYPRFGGAGLLAKLKQLTEKLRKNRGLDPS